MTTPAQRALDRETLCRVPEITAYFWLLKSLSTAMGESTSDFLVHLINPVVAVLLGFVAFSLALARQLHAQRYRAWSYWTCVTMVGVFGTMAADVLHVGLHIAYVVSMIFFAVLLAVIFALWHKSEQTLSMHTITTPRRELYYWATVVATFALGTAVSDFTAATLHLGYITSIGLFAVLIMIPVTGYYLLNWNAILSFWFAYVLTRPLGASVADTLGKPKNVGGIAIGAGWVALVFTLMIAAIVNYLARTNRDRQERELAEPAIVTS